MATDVTAVRYECPFCDEDFATERKCKRHISDSDDKAHRSKNGFEIDRPINVNRDNSRLPLHKKLAKAADEFDQHGYEEAKRVAELADVSFHRVLAEWDKQGVELSGIRSDAGYKWERLSERQKNILASKYKNPDTANIELARKFGCHRASVSKVMRQKGFLLEDRYRPDDIETVLEEETEKEVEQEDGNEVPAQMNGDTNLIQALEDSGVEYKVNVSVEDDMFEAISSLIEAGHKDVAEELYEK